MVQKRLLALYLEHIPLLHSRYKNEEFTAVAKQGWDSKSYGTVVPVNSKRCEDKKVLLINNFILRKIDEMKSVVFLRKEKQTNIHSSHNAALTQALLGSLEGTLGKDKNRKGVNMTLWKAN